MIKQLIKFFTEVNSDPFLSSEIRFKLTFINSMLLLGGVASACMIPLRMQHSLVVGSLTILFSSFMFSMRYYVHRNIHQLERVSIIAICTCYVFFTSIYVLAPYNKTRVAIYFLLVASALYLKGKRLGLFWLVLTCATIMLVQFVGLVDTGFSNADVLIFVLYLSAFYYIIYANFETLRHEQEHRLLDFNAHLETQIHERTQALQTLNQALQLEKEALRTLSHQDQLTGLGNRLKFQEIFWHEGNQFARYQKALSLILLDVDKFKQINDGLGHQVGDAVLVEVGRILQTSARKSDVAVRWGGDEFAVLATNTDFTQAQVLAETIRANVEKADFLSKHGVAVTVSVGVAAVREDDTLDTAMRRADDALYTAKNAGRNIVKTELDVHTPTAAQ